jgi:hypothetical protein
MKEQNPPLRLSLTIGSIGIAIFCALCVGKTNKGQDYTKEMIYLFVEKQI